MDGLQMVRIGDGGGGGGGGGGGENSKPAWLEGLMEETFFAGCGAHETRRKNEKNIFCLACCLSFCPHCLPSHRSHPLLQVRRYVYHDVVRLVDLQKLIDCSFIQPYTINGAKVIFLKQRTQPSSRSNNRVWKAAAGGGGSTSAPNLCFTCDRILQSPFHFCSLSCKVDHVVCQGGEGLTSMWMSSSSQLEGLRLNSALLDDNDNDNDNDNDEDDDDDHDAPNTRSQPEYYYEGPATRNPSSSNATAETFLKRKKNEGGAGPTTTTTDGGSGSASRTSRFLSVFSLNNSRRKSAPHRAPLS
ncbi:hypothetical protein V2J09_016180 [Rumex salicifolius]